MKKILVGVDEAGRGPLAGPVSVGVASVPENFDWDVVPLVNDSKKLSEKNREVIFAQATKLRREGKIDWKVVMVSATIIDKKGIVFAINSAMVKCLKAVASESSKCRVLLDGSLHAPEQYENQETIIKGDSKEKIIGLASIVAKVTRDRYMVKKSTDLEFIPYEFASHKGYGTRAHCQAIKKYGLSTIHRATYCKNLLPK